MKITEIDANFKPTTTDENGFEWYDASGLCLYGVTKYEDGYARLPKVVGESTNDGVAALYRNTAGGRVRFYTDSPEIAIKAEYECIARFPHMPLSGVAGFTLTADFADEPSRWIKTFIPPYGTESSFTASTEIDSRAHGAIGYTVHMPLYSSLKSLFIGVKKGYAVARGKKYAPIAPVLFYGSSITQGGCASTPASDYISVISRRLNLDIVNLGFSGSARGEDIMADYIGSQKISAFVYDYDHNATDLEYYAATHERFFKRFRDLQPTTPVIIMTRPDVYNAMAACGEAENRIAVATVTYENAVKNGDKNVYFIDGRTLVTGDSACYCYVDGCHPTDLGFMRMADTVQPVLEKILFSKEI